MPEGLPKFTSVPDEEARRLTPEEVAEASANIERDPNLTESIRQEEEKLSENVKRSETTIEEASKKPDASKWNYSKIHDAYEKAKSRIDEFAALGLIGGGTAMLSSEVVAGKWEQMKDSTNLIQNIDAEQWRVVATKLMEGGVEVSMGVVAAWAIARGVNWLQRRSRENALYGKSQAA